MSGYLDKPQSHESSDAKARRKLVDQRRMEYRRAIESYSEQRQLQHELVDYPELLVFNYLELSRNMQPRL
ncbi:MAG: transcriptional regulator [Pseudomonadaceae bacterium]|uniref:PA3496 family putative envelope integrity protein n=1 Tax=Pseudomonas sp. Ga0074129 TaxID=1752219 RepID=UPI000A7F47CB|nr:transcriptional regulator [Pseudomonas sp. Ga0074129]MBX9762153.1 transcriptional regulator [Pseudomonadaceae bacterium]